MWMEKCERQSFKQPRTSLLPSKMSVEKKGLRNGIYNSHKRMNEN